jgi:hypothetical protein
MTAIARLLLDYARRFDERGPASTRELHWRADEILAIAPRNWDAIRIARVLRSGHARPEWLRVLAAGMLAKAA